jgi:hypothetical protein
MGNNKENMGSLWGLMVSEGPCHSGSTAALDICTREYFKGRVRTALLWRDVGAARKSWFVREVGERRAACRDLERKSLSSIKELQGDYMVYLNLRMGSVELFIISKTTRNS